MSCLHEMSEGHTDGTLHLQRHLGSNTTQREVTTALVHQNTHRNALTFDQSHRKILNDVVNEDMPMAIPRLEPEYYRGLGGQLGLAKGWLG